MKIRIVFDGWDIGMRKIPFTKLLHEKAGMSLTDAKRAKDRLVANDGIVEIVVQSEDLANEILAEALCLNVKGRIIRECQNGELS